MHIQLDEELQKEYLDLIRSRAERNPFQTVRYLDLGTTAIRILCLTEEILPILNKQFTFVLRENMEHYDSTVVVYKEKNTADLANNIYCALTVRQKMKIKAEMMWFGTDTPIIQAAEKNGTELLIVDGIDGVAEAFDQDSRTYYYGVSDFDPEKLSKFGHCFKQILYSLVKSKTVHMTHGAVMGYKGTGFLLCGRGKRGKSTLTVQSMLQRFEYVSDDFQLLEKTDRGLLSYPIYSVITLSHHMYHEMYDLFKGKFVCNNYERDKYVFNIEAYHGQFRSAYLINFCLFPEITADERPSIQLCDPEEKGRAIVHIIHSTMAQTNSLNDREGIHKLLDMVKPLPFYKIRLCKNIVANTDYLRDFLETGIIPDFDPQPLPGILKDITFGLATFLDTDNCRFYTMNKFATNVYQLLSSGVPESEVICQLEKYKASNSKIMKEFEELQNMISLFGLYGKIENTNDFKFLNGHFAEKSGYHLSVIISEGCKTEE